MAVFGKADAIIPPLRVCSRYGDGASPKKVIVPFANNSTNNLRTQHLDAWATHLAGVSRHGDY